MLILRLARAGTKKRPVYHLVATDSRNRRDGRFVENLGYFIPSKDVVVLKQDRVDYWLSVGAETSEVASHLIRTARKKPVVATLPTEKKPRRSAKPLAKLDDNAPGAAAGQAKSTAESASN
jgi:small subunit ribosomal protein S16